MLQGTFLQEPKEGKWFPTRKIRRNLYAPSDKNSIYHILSYLYENSALGPNDLPPGSVQSLCVKTLEDRFRQLLTPRRLDNIVLCMQNRENLPATTEVNLAPNGIIVQGFIERRTRPCIFNIIGPPTREEILTSNEDNYYHDTSEPERDSIPDRATPINPSSEPIVNTTEVHLNSQQLNEEDSTDSETDFSAQFQFENLLLRLQEQNIEYVSGDSNSDESNSTASNRNEQTSNEFFDLPPLEVNTPPIHSIMDEIARGFGTSSAVSNSRRRNREVAGAL